MVDAPLDAGDNQTIYVRGRYILDAVFGTLAARHGLAGATDYVSNGNSAGGLGNVPACRLHLGCRAFLRARGQGRGCA
jgi:hypothetical protein